ncbi:MAG: DUF5946 family protein [Gemmatimonadota bacterium]
MSEEACPSCGLKTENSDGAVHRYLESSPGCWARYGELLASEYENPAFMSAHELTVDAYALQHPGRESPQTISSAHVHLASLYSYFELGTPVTELHGVKQRVVRYKDGFVWLEPPEDLGAITVVDVLESETAAEHCAAVRRWAKYVFGQWQRHHRSIARILDPRPARAC